MSFIKGVFTVSSLTIVSRVVGVFRESLLSYFLGACAEMDAFLVAFKFPRFFRVCFEESGFQSVFVPYFVEYTEKGKIKAASIFASRAINLMFWCTLLLVIIVLLFTDKFILAFAPGFASDAEKFKFALDFTRITFPSVIMLALSSVCIAVLVSYKKFFQYAIIPILINIVLICSIVTFRDVCSTGYRIAYGVLVASTVQFAVVFYFVVTKTKIRLFPILRMRIGSRFKKVLKKMMPIVLSASLAQLNVFIDTCFGSYLPSGAITFIYFADRFNQLPLAIFGASMAAVLLPEISIAIVRKDNKYIAEMNKTLIVNVMRLVLPVVVLLSMHAYLLVGMLYGHGKFSSNCIEKTALVLQLFATGLPAYIMGKIFFAILFARKDVKTPVIAGIVSVTCNAILNFLLIRKYGVNGIALSTSIAGFVSACILYRKSGLCINKTSMFGLVKIIIACVGLYFTIKMCNIYFCNWSDFVRLCCNCIIGCIVYFCILLALFEKGAINTIKLIGKHIKLA